MPIYEYKCSKGHVTEVKQTSFDPEDYITCPECENEMKKKVAVLQISKSDFEIKNKPVGQKKWF